MIFAFHTPFDDQLEFFRQKLNLPTERWDDIARAAHDRAFIVAGAQKADLLADLNRAVDKAIEHGLGLEEFRRDFKQIVAAHGWTGWTGQGTKAGEAWRTQVIYQTNMATSYAAGRYKQLTDPEFLKVAPWWRYVHDDSVTSPRQLHAAWGAARLTLRYDHPFWQTHFPPNGWGCHCRVTPVSAPEPGAATEPPDGWDQRNGKGDLPGIDKGFDYAPGASVRQPLQDFLDQKLIKLDAPIGAAMWEALAPTLTAEERAAQFSLWVDRVMSAGVSRNEWRVVGAIRQVELDYLAGAGRPSPVSAEIVIEDRLLVGKKARRHEGEGDALTSEEWKSIPLALETERKTYFDKQDGKLLYVFPALDDSRSIRLAVEIDFVTTRPKRTVNMARSGFKINVQALQDRTRYDEIE